MTNLTASTWYHIAFVFDCATRNQSVYLDGVLDFSRQSNISYQGTNGSLTIGMNTLHNPSFRFDGLIDQLSFTNRSTTSDEILRDATLTLYVSFDGNSTNDQGPLRINGSLEGNTTFASGRRAEALQIYDVQDSYFTVHDLVLLGRANQPYSFSVWIKPAVIRTSTIIHMSLYPDGTGWCLAMLGMTNIGELVTTASNTTIIQVTGPVVPTNSWTHVATTYSLANGLRLYVNGSLYNTSSLFSFYAAGAPTHLIIGSPRNGTYCGWPYAVNGQYSGAVDELYAYSRELSPADISLLANV